MAPDMSGRKGRPTPKREPVRPRSYVITWIEPNPEKVTYYPYVSHCKITHSHSEAEWWFEYAMRTQDKSNPYRDVVSLPMPHIVIVSGNAREAEDDEYESLASARSLPKVRRIMGFARQERAA
jgi:hypothetical protein